MRHSYLRHKFSISAILLAAFFVLLWIAGGASRADAAGQIFVRGGAAAALIIMCLFGERPSLTEFRPVAFLLIAALVLVLVQLVPLPPDLWQALPGRALDIAAVGSDMQPWRPWSISPSATLNAAFSFIVPFTVLVLLAGLTDAERPHVLGFLLGLINAAMLLGLLQFSGVQINNPLINDVPGQVAGNFANRNHFALFLAMGCLIAPVWAFLGGREPGWRAPAALALVILFTLTILASGSRAGMLVGGLALGLALAMVWSGLRRAMRRYPRWVSFALPGGAIALVLFFVLISVVAGRAVSIDRAFVIDQGQDMRTRGLPTVLEIIREYFPFGSGFGSFDMVFRVHEPFSLLKPTYFNHAHNDLLEVGVGAGLLGFLLLFVALVWWAWASERAWRAGSSMRHAVPKLGSAMLLLVVFASAFDYPARTPMIAAMVIVAAVLLSQRTTALGGSALPQVDQHL